MKRILLVLFAVILSVTCFATVALAADVSVKLDGETLAFEQPPVIIEGRTLVPLRAIFEALGATVEWNGETKTVTSTKGDVTIKLAIGSNVLNKNDESVELDVPAQIVGEGYTMVPARAIAESFGVTVDWDDATKTVVLTSPVVDAPVEPETVEGTVVNLIRADTYTGNSNYYYGNCVDSKLKMVANPIDANDKVFVLEPGVNDKASWTYFWVKDTKYIPGQTYIAEYDIYIESDVFGYVPEKATFGTNFRYGDNAEGGASKDRGVAPNGKSSVMTVPTATWQHVQYIYTIPETINLDAEMKFGVYGNPIKNPDYSFNTALKYYIDNISVVPYSGDKGHGPVAGANAIHAMNKFDIDAVDGIVIDFDSESVLEEVPFGKVHAPELKDGHIYLTVAEGVTTDVQANYKTSFDASEYNAVAFKVKSDAPAFADSYFAVYYATEDDPKLSQAKSKAYGYVDCKLTEDGYYIGYIDFSDVDEWKGTITTLRFDPMEHVVGTVAVDKLIIFKK